MRDVAADLLREATLTILTKTRRDWESIFTTWSQPPGQTEQERCERAVRAVSGAIDADPTLSGKKISTFPQGSYRNRTNVRQDSDVDVCILCRDVIFVEYPEGVTDSDAGLHDSSYRFSEYKDDVERALVSRFGRPNVRRGNKAFDVNENTYRVDADGAPCFIYRSYYFSSSGKLRYREGTALIADDTRRCITNFPEQQYANGVAKNDATGRRFKKSVRIIKKLRYQMEDAGYKSAEAMASFLIESLVWNAPDHLFSATSLRDMVQGILAHLWEQTRADATCNKWTEENGIKFLFHNSQSWTRAQANQFLCDAWNYVENG